MPTYPRGPRRPARRGRRQTIAVGDAWCDAPAGVASVDTSADVGTVVVRLVIDDATRPYREVARAEQEVCELDAARVDQVLDGRVPTTDALDGQTRDAVRARAQHAADQTRSRRHTGVVRQCQQLGFDWVRRLRGRGPNAVPDRPLVVAFHGNARVWSGRRFVAPRWTWRSSSWWCAGAGGC
jgi:hypothetical protein